MKKTLSILCLLLSTSLFAQVEEARKYIQDLTAPNMFGRGYVNNGIQKAYDYIQDVLDFQFGLMQFWGDSGQLIEYSVNTFPDKLSLKIDGAELNYGEDFIIDGASCGGTKSLKCIQFSKSDLQDVCSGSSVSKLKEKYKTKYQNTCLIFDETDTALSQKEINIINDWITYDLVHSTMYPIGAIIKITNQKLTQNISGNCGIVPYFIVSDKNLKSKTPKSISFDVTQKIEKVTSGNFGADIEHPNANEGPDYPKTLFFTAHYDHLGQFGQTVYQGANDNASGIAMLLTLAKYFKEHHENLKVNLCFVAFTGEELGLLGSRAFVNDNEWYDIEPTDFVINLDMVGTGDEGICVVNGKVYEKEMDLLNKINEENHYFSNIQLRGEACNSDHCSFDKAHIPCFYIYTKGGTQAYHDIHDTADQLPLTKFNELFNLLVKFAEEYQ